MTVKNGRLFSVLNKDRKFGATSKYVFTYLEDSTENPEDLLEKDRLTDWFD